MPRKRLVTQTGQPAQAVGPTPGQQYGKGEEQMALQRAMPAPQATQRTVLAPPAQAVSQLPGVQQAPADPQQLASIVEAMRGKAGLLRGGTGRPAEPVTSGLSSGPGPGPEILGLKQGSPTGVTLRNLSRLTGDPLFQELADRAGM